MRHCLRRRTGAVSTWSPGHLNRSSSLISLATNLYLSARYEQHGLVEDLSEVIVLNREALLLWTSGHPERSESLPLSNLATCIAMRYQQFDEIV